MSVEEAITRMRLAVNAGADVCFIEAVKAEELESIVSVLHPVPVSYTLVYSSAPEESIICQVLVNSVPSSLAPSFTYQDAETLGAKIISKCAAWNRCM